MGLFFQVITFELNTIFVLQFFFFAKVSNKKKSKKKQKKAQASNLKIRFPSHIPPTYHHISSMFS